MADPRPMFLKDSVSVCSVNSGWSRSKLKSADVVTESLKPTKKSKAELEQLIKANGGKIYQTHNATPGTVCIAGKSEQSSRIPGLV